MVSRLKYSLMEFFFRHPRFDHRLQGYIRKYEGGLVFSQTWRELLAKYYGVHVGKYSYGPILWRDGLPRGSKVGNWCSVGRDLIVRRRNHPIERVTQHPIFYNAGLGFVERDTIETEQENPLTIGHDVWIGDRVTILSGCKSVGNGAVLAAGAVVTKDVPPYAIMGGAPAKQIKSRFSPEIQDILEETRWWELDAPELAGVRELLLETLTADRARAFAAACEEIRIKRG